MLSIWSSLAGVPDPRSGNARRHKLLDVLTIALTAAICGAESCVDFADFVRDREALFGELLELPGGLPSHDTFSRLFRLLDPTVSQPSDGMKNCQTPENVVTTYSWRPATTHYRSIAYRLSFAMRSLLTVQHGHETALGDLIS